MIKLIENEFIKLKRQSFLVFLLLLSSFPVLIGGARTLMNGTEFTIAELFFFANNLFSMFFPMAMFILIGALFYTEYKNGTYITFITYGYSKPKLFLSKLLVANIIGLFLVMFVAVTFIFTALLADIFGKPIYMDASWISLGLGFFVQSIIVVTTTSCMGAIAIVLSKNMIVSSAVGIFYGFFSVLFIGLDNGRYIAGSFAYRLCMALIDKNVYYDDIRAASITGGISVLLTIIVTLAFGVVLFARKRKIEV